jgi:hypothetical protein
MNGRPAASQSCANALAQQVDDLYELRGLIRKSQEAEKKLTAQMLGTLEAAGLSQFDGAQAVAIVGERVNLVPDVQLFLEAPGTSRATIGGS